MVFSSSGLSGFSHNGNNRRKKPGKKRPGQGPPPGKMSNSHGELKFPYVTWEVPNFSSLPREIDYFVDSPKFHFDGGTWCLRLFPWGNDEGSKYDGDYVVIWLMRLVSPIRELHSFEIGLIKNDGKELELELEENAKKHIMCEGQKLFGYGFYIWRDTLEENNDTYAPLDTLTVFCRVLSSEITTVTTSPAATEHTATQTEMEGASFEPPSCGKDTPSVEKLRSDYKKLLKSEAESDLLVVVSGREFRAHKNILRARSPVFDAMFEHETEEKQSGKVVIEDLNPDAFRDFLEYLYTGHVEALSDENVFGLYAAADKYDVQPLKLETVEHMRRTLSVESFCDVMKLALRHLEQDLLDRAVDFFKDNLPDIIVTVKWQVFLKENSTTANELFVKTFVPKKEK